MRNHMKSRASNDTAFTLRQRAALARDAAGRFIQRVAGQVTDQPQPASLPEGSVADGHGGAFPTAAKGSHHVGRGHSANFDRATAEHGRAPHQEHDMGRHETFENAAPYSDALLAGTILGRAATVAFPAPGSAEAKAAFKAACHEHSVRTAALNECPELTRAGGGAWTRQSLGKAMDTGEVSPAEYARLYPLASERELQIEAVGHELNLGSLFALAHADEYPLNANPADTDTSNGDAELLAFSKDWETAAAAYEQAIQDQIIITDRAPIIETPPAREPHEQWAQLIPGWRERTGVDAAEAATAEALDVLCEIEDRISAMPAATLAGLKLKARVAQRNEEVSWPEGLEESLVRDILAIGEPEIEADADLLRLGRQFEAARAREAAACEACNEAQREANRLMPERPASLIYRASDEPLGVYQYLTDPESLNGGEISSTDIERLRRIMPMKHEVLRPIRSGERAHRDHPGRKFDIVPYPEAQARAEEIITAWDAWRAEQSQIQDEHVTPELDDVAVAAGEAAASLAEQIALLPARTATGFRVKLRALSYYRRKALLSELPEEPDPDQLLSHSLWRDVQDEPVANDDHPVTVEEAATLDFAAYTFDIPTRDPNGWMEEFSHHAIGMHVADRTLRMGKDELVVFIRKGGTLDTDVPITMLKAMECAQRTFEGWGKLLSLACSRYMVASSFAVLDHKGAEATTVAPDAAPMPEPETPPVAAPLPTDSLVGMLDLASASMRELQTIRDMAERVGSMAYVHAWSPRCRNGANAYGAPHFNAAGKMVQWVGDILTAVESAAEKEARRRTPDNEDDRETRLSMLAVTTIDNGDPDETEAFARELLAHVEADWGGR